MIGFNKITRYLSRWRNVRWLALAAVVPAALWACNSHPFEQPAPAPEAQTDRIYELNPLRQLDLIFVIDNSSSMDQEQENIKRNFPDFMRQLENIKGGLPDIRIAVISSNFGAGPGMPAPECPVFGDRGGFLVRPNCGLDSASKGFWLSIDGKGNKNFDGDLGNVFSCMASLGINGCGYEHQLQSLRASLAASDPNSPISPQNRNFLRRDAFLGIVILSDEDDCSGEPGATFYQEPVPGQAGSLRCALLGHVCNGQPITPNKDFRSTVAQCQPYERQASEVNSRLINVKEFVDFVKAVKGGNEDKIIVSSIVGWTPNPDTTPYGLFERPSVFGGTELDLQPTCQEAATGAASPALRLTQFTRGFRNNTIHTICQASLSDAMKQIGEKFALVLENTCITSPLVDTDLQTTGVQPDCQVRDRVPRDDGIGYVESPLPSCAFGQSPCWELTADAACGSGYRTTVRRPNNTPPPPNTLQVVQCLTCTEAADPARCPARPAQ
jgi:hypothetical protein